MKELPDNYPYYEKNYEYDKYNPVRYSRHERRAMASQQRKRERILERRRRDYLIRRRKEIDLEIGEEHDRLFEQARREYYAECEEAWKNYNVDKRKD